MRQRAEGPTAVVRSRARGIDIVARRVSEHTSHRTRDATSARRATLHMGHAAARSVGSAAGAEWAHKPRTATAWTLETSPRAALAHHWALGRAPYAVHIIMLGCWRAARGVCAVCFYLLVASVDAGLETPGRRVHVA
jgi:hypothetical protein